MKKILVVEDDKKISLAIAVRLKSKGYKVVLAYDALAGVTMAAKEMPDLILLDISMPAGGGFSVAERVQNRADTAGTPIVFITASKKPGLRESAAEVGGVAFLEKPFTAEILISIVQEALGDPVDSHPGDLLRPVKAR
jgi:CheY-like chemotaxis protein